MTDRDPEEAAADARARRMPASPLLIVLVIALIGVLIYVASAVLA